MNSTWQRLAPYVYSQLLVALALAARWAIDPWAGDRVAFIFLMFALVAISMRWGIRLGMTSMAVGCLATMWLFLAPRDTFFVEGLSQHISIAGFLAISVILVLLGDGFNRHRVRTRDFENLLGDHFKRTGEVIVSSRGGATPSGSASQAALGGDRFEAMSFEAPLGRILCEAIPEDLNTINTRHWQLVANGEPVVDIRIVREGFGGKPNELRKWVVTYFNGN